ncbi:hypothetical protein HPB50_008401 [Hyalomma asiaticum]|uniref:Uncharacterized protein n=1 Tax=Hyalomma asiaticum TaxID=266040 RepID=A0ACB7RTN3_HYAAI|nr:hypothetical protein HPB50_008401 [Hyalomma asiaticum]
MSSFMRRHFKWYEVICKSCGLAILRSPGTADSDADVNHFLNKWHIIYSVVCLWVYASVELSYVYQLWLAVFVHNRVFATTVDVLLYVATAGKAALNTSVALVKARSLQTLFRESCKYERSVQFVAPKNRRTLTPIHCLVRPLLLLAFAANVCTSSYLSFKFVDRLGCGPALRAVLKLTSIAGNILFYVYDAVSFLVLRPCCEVIRLYIEHQHEVLRCIVKVTGTQNAGQDRRARLVERVRLNLCTVSHLKGCLNQIWGCSIAASGAVLLCTSCGGIYLNFVEEFWTPEHVLNMLHTISMSLDFLDITNLSDSMVREVRKIRHTLQKARTSSEDRDYVDQVRYLRDSLKAREMALSGAGFFSLKLPMLVSLAGTIITYTVILVQTSESVKKR